MKWIELIKEKPDYDEDIFLYSEVDNSYGVGYVNSKDTLVSFPAYLAEKNMITHWMEPPPLPNPARGIVYRRFLMWQKAKEDCPENSLKRKEMLNYEVECAKILKQL